MRKVKKVITFTVTFLLILSMTFSCTQAAYLIGGVHKTYGYKISDEVQAAIDKVYKRYNFSMAWGVYDISGRGPREVASHHAEKLFQSNCTIKAAMLLYICKQMDAGKIALDTKLKVNTGKLHYDDFERGSGNYTVEYLLTRMIHVSNNACYEVLLRYISLTKFNAFLKSLGSGTTLTSYNYMGNCTVRNRAIEWYELFQYCHSKKTNAAFAWKLLTNAKYSPIRDGLKCTVAHKSGWHDDEDVYGTAGDCAVIKTENGGCYLMIMFTRNNAKGKYSQALMRELAVALNKVWNEYYLSLPKARRKTVTF